MDIGFDMMNSVGFLSRVCLGCIKFQPFSFKQRSSLSIQYASYSSGRKEKDEHFHGSWLSESDHLIAKSPPIMKVDGTKDIHPSP